MFFVSSSPFEFFSASSGNIAELSVGVERLLCGMAVYFTSDNAVVWNLDYYSEHRAVKKQIYWYPGL